jgi:lysophospholipase L1-like esterase
MKKLLVPLLFLLPVLAFAQETIDLSGTWRFAIDKNNVGITQKWFSKTLEDNIQLPGSMLENRKGEIVTAQTQWTGSLYDSTYYYSPAMEKYRQPGNVKFPFFLTPDFHYTGAAWYQTTVTIPGNWKGSVIQLYLERPHIETTVWVDSQQAGAEQYSYCIPHIYDLTPYLQAGKSHTITIRIDNTIKPQYNPGIDSHSITDQTQGNWNGIVGKINLNATPSVSAPTIQIYPDIHTKTARVVISLENKTNQSVSGKIFLSAESFNSDKQHKIPEISSDFVAKPGKTEKEITLNMGDGMLTWDEFDPALYKLKTTIDCRDVARHVFTTTTTQFGMREIKIDGKWFYVNGRKIMLRGTVENCDFPLTGYAPMDVDSWLKVFKICRDHGLNHIRFHSFCPPEAAFIAADLTGMYLQPEGPSWPNHGVALGRGMAIDTFLLQETQMMNKFYGNYASFCMLACGNEPAGNWVPWVSRFVEYWEKADPRKVYTGASVGGSWAWQPRSQYHVKAGARGLTWNTNPETLSDYRTRIDTVKQPYVSHETGQWCVFPNFNEISKYTGVYKAKNFEIFRDVLAENDMSALANDFLMASGKLQALCYKHEIEKTMRTPDYAGFQLLALNDYSGQGTALVGILDVFWEEKPYINAAQFRRFCNATVPLTRMEKFVFKNNEPFQAQVEMYHFGPNPMFQAQVEWKITDTQGLILDKGAFAPTNIPIGNCFEIGNIETSLSQITKATQLNLEVSIAGTSFVNDWDFWVYPETVSLDQGNVLVTDTLDEKARQTLEQGGNVLLLAAGKIQYGRDVKQQLTPIFWNTSWFKMRPPHTTGLLVNPQHPVFADFPTQYHSNLQWAELVNGAQVMQFTEFPEGFQPLVQNIHTWFISKKIGSLFEARVGKGKLMMTSLDLQTDLDKRFVARQLLSSILQYMNSPKFQPEYTVDVQRVSDLFTKSSEAINTFTKDAPDELKVKPFAEKLPDGNYRVRLTLGNDEEEAKTTVQAESRRLFLYNIQTKRGEFKTYSFTVNKRNKYIGDNDSVRIKPREIGKLNWDDYLTIEFNGDKPGLSKIEVQPVNDAITVFLCGNSTVVDQDDEPWAAWGQMIPAFFNEQVSFANYAESGESSNTFIAAKRLEKALTFMKPGDYVLIEFGHNDEKQKGEDKGAYKHFTKSLQIYIDEARKRGAYPILITPTQRRNFDESGKLIETHGDFPQAVRDLAAKENVPLIDLTAMTSQLYYALGVEGSKKALVHYPKGTFPGQTADLADNTHFNAYGAYQVAQCVIEGLKANQVPFIQYLREKDHSYNPARPDNPDAFYWKPPVSAKVQKPDGN